MFANKGSDKQDIAVAASFGVVPICGNISYTLGLQSLFLYSWHYYMSMDISCQYLRDNMQQGILKASLNILVLSIVHYRPMMDVTRGVNVT